MWDVTSIWFSLVEVSAEDWVWTWASDLAAEDAWAKPTGFAIVGQAELYPSDFGKYGLGLADKAGNGIMASYDAGLDTYETVDFSMTNAPATNGVIPEPDWFNQVYTIYPGQGDEWGQFFDGESWSIWSYNDGRTSDWEAVDY